MTRSDFRFFHPYRVRYSDIDSQRVVYYAQVYVIANAAIHEYFEWLDFPYMVGGWEKAGTDFHFAHSSAEYRRPITYDARLQVGVRMAKLGNSSLTLAVHLFDGEAEAASVEIKLILVNFDQETRRPAPLSDAFVAGVAEKEDVTRAG